MSQLAQGDIVLVPHAPYSNQLQTKTRPALVVSALSFNQAQADVILMAISSQLHSGDPRAVQIDAQSPYFTQTKLLKPGTIKCGAIFAYQADQIKRRLGTLPVPLLERVKSNLKTILGF